jgi:hypothetical protein
MGVSMIKSSAVNRVAMLECLPEECGLTIQHVVHQLKPAVRVSLRATDFQEVVTVLLQFRAVLTFE